MSGQDTPGVGGVPMPPYPEAFGGRPKHELLRERFGEPDDLADAGDVMRSTEKGISAIAAFGAATRQLDEDPVMAGVGVYRGVTDHALIAEVAGDLICAVMHAVQRLDIDAEEVVAAGTAHFLAEVGMGYEG